MGYFMLAFLCLSIIFIIGWKYFYLNTTKMIGLKNFISLHKNFLWLVSSLVCLVCVVVYFTFRYSGAISNIKTYDLFNLDPSNFRSSNLSGLFMLDLCSFLGIISPLLVIFDWKKKILLRPISILCCLGSCITLFFSASSIYDEWDVYAFFFGAKSFGMQEDMPLTFIMHYWMAIIGTLVLVWTPRFKLRDYITLIIIAIIYVSYVIAISRTFEIYSHCTGLVQGDFVDMSNVIKDYYNAKDKNGNLLLDKNSNIITSEIYPTYATFMNIFPIYNWEHGAIFAWLCFIWFSAMILVIKWLFDKYEDKVVNYFTYKEEYLI